MALRDNKGSAQIGPISGSAERNPSPAPAIPARGAQASVSSAGYAEVYEGSQRRDPARMAGGDTTRTPQQQVRADVHTRNLTRNPTPFLPSKREEQTRRDVAGAEEDAIYDVGITDYSSNDRTQIPEYEQGYQRPETVDQEGYEIPLSAPSKYMNKDTVMNEENDYQDINEVEMMIQRDNDDEDDDDHYDDTEL